MLDQVLSVFDIKPQYDLDIMKPGQSLTDAVAEILRKVREFLCVETFVASLASFYEKARIGHVAAVSQVLKTHPRTKFLIVGRGDIEESLKEAVKRDGLEKHVRFLGFREDVAALLSLMDIFVLPSLPEGLSKRWSIITKGFTKTVCKGKSRSAYCLT
jgi:glycosyltransferase involved in cell wall biosynthesis